MPASIPAMQSTRPRSDSVLGFQLVQTALSRLVADVVEAVRNRNHQIVFACANVHSIVLARSDPAFGHALTRATHLVPDGIGLLIAGRIKGVRLGPRITGADYFEAVSRGLHQRGGGKVYFLGSTTEVLGRIKSRFKSDYPNLEVCGIYSPPFGDWGDEDNKVIVDLINAAKPDVLWVGMTAPKQEKWIEKNRSALQVPVVGAIGAVFDFYAGTKRRAPEWMCRCGLEWVYRFLREPTRMWRRHFISIPKFVGLVLAESFATRFGRSIDHSISGDELKSPDRRS